MAIVQISAFKCERCGWVWLRDDRKMDPPLECSKCHSYYWNRPRRNKRK